jgi:hypothetical protein
MAMKLDQIVNQVEEVCDCFLLLQKSLVKRPSSDLRLLGGATILAIYSTLHFMKIANLNLFLISFYKLIR